MEKRNNNTETTQGTPSTQQRVGGRQGCIHPPARGGGYLQTCIGLKLGPSGLEKNRDPRLKDLYNLGLHPTWQKVAETIGMDHFLALWRILDAEEQFIDHGARIDPVIRRYRAYIRYQRNTFIRQLASEDYDPPEICRRVAAQLGEPVSRRTVLRVIHEDIK